MAPGLEPAVEQVDVIAYPHFPAMQVEIEMMGSSSSNGDSQAVLLSANNLQ